MSWPSAAAISSGVNRQAPVGRLLGGLGLLGGCCLPVPSPWRGTDVKPRASPEGLDEQQPGKQAPETQGKKIWSMGDHHSGEKTNQADSISRSYWLAVASACHSLALWMRRFGRASRHHRLLQPLQKPKRGAKRGWYSMSINKSFLKIRPKAAVSVAALSGECFGLLRATSSHLLRPFVLLALRAAAVTSRQLLAVLLSSWKSAKTSRRHGPACQCCPWPW